MVRLNQEIKESEAGKFLADNYGKTVSRRDFDAAFARWCAGRQVQMAENGPQQFRRVENGDHRVFAMTGAPEPLTVGTVQRFLDDVGAKVDYIHGAQAACQIAAEYDGPAVALLMPEFAKADLFKGVVLGGVLPRKTFSMGHAEEKRYYNECRALAD